MANLEVYKNTKFEKLLDLFDITQRFLLDHQAEILNVPPIYWTAPSWTRSTLYSRPNDHVDERKSTRLLRFRLMLGEDVRARIKDGNIKLKNFDSPTLTEN